MVKVFSGVLLAMFALSGTSFGQVAYKQVCVNGQCQMVPVSSQIAWQAPAVTLARNTVAVQCPCNAAGLSCACQYNRGVSVPMTLAIQAAAQPVTRTTVTTTETVQTALPAGFTVTAADTAEARQPLFPRLAAMRAAAKARRQARHQAIAAAFSASPCGQ